MNTDHIPDPGAEVAWREFRLAMAIGDARRKAYPKSVEYAAIQFVALKDAAVQLRKRRAACVCVHETQMDDEGILHSDGHTVCWKPIDLDGDEEGRPIYANKEDWCEPCLARQKIHEEYKATVKLRGAALRSLIARVRNRKATR